MGASERRKGHDFEREIANRIAKATGREVARNSSEPQTGNAGDILSDLPLSVQCKVGKRAPNIWQAVREAEEPAKDDHRFAVAFCRMNRGNGHSMQEVAVLPADDLLEILGLLTGTGVW